MLRVVFVFIVVVPLIRYHFQDENVNLMWKEKEIDIGKFKVGVEQKIFFYHTGGKEIQAVKAGCGCTDLSIIKNVDSHGVEVKYIEKKFPATLKARGQQETPVRKEITVTFDDRTRSKLYIKGILCQ